MILEYSEKENLSEMLAVTSAKKVTNVSFKIYEQIEKLYQRFLKKELTYFEFNGLVNTIIDQNIDDISNETDSQLNNNVEKEVKATDGLLKKTAIVAGVALLSKKVRDNIREKAILNNPYYANEFQNVKPALKSRIIQNVYDIVANNKNMTEAAQQLNNVKNVNGRELQQIIRTMSRDVQTQSMLGTYRENKIKYVRFIAKVDSRTTKICLSFNGMEFPIDDCPEPALHYNCRSIIMPIQEPTGKLRSFRQIYIDNSSDRDLGRIKYV